MQTNIRHILALVTDALAAGTSDTDIFLADALTSFASNPINATRAIRGLQAADPSGFAVAALRQLTSDSESPAMQFLAGLVFTNELLVEPLLHPSLLSLQAALVLASNVSAVVPMLDVKLVKRLTEATPAPDEVTSLRILEVIERVSDGHRLMPFLTQLLRNPSARVRSKAARMVGHAYHSVSAARQMLTDRADDADGRLRANVIEEVLPDTDDARELLWEAAGDHHHRVAVNALVGLARGGDRQAAQRLVHFAADPRPLFRSAAVWGLGELRNPDAIETLQQAARDRNPKVRSMAIRSLVKLRKALGLDAAAGKAAGSAERSVRRGSIDRTVV